MIVVIMGVSGAGKSTIGMRLAAALRCALLEGDSLHPAPNVAKMSAGVALTDQDRLPWLDLIHERMRSADARGECLIVACSALKKSYREKLEKDLEVRWVFLNGSPGLIAARIGNRTGHFMSSTLLGSQFQALEVPADAIWVDVRASIPEIIERLAMALRQS